MHVSTPPSTLSVANTVNGNTVSYTRNMNTNGAHKNHARAQTPTDSINIFFFSADTKSAVQIVNKQRLLDVPNLMAIVGNISRATTCDSFTVGHKFFDQYWRESFVIRYSLVAGMNHVK